MFILNIERLISSRISVANMYLKRLEQCMNFFKLDFLNNPCHRIFTKELF